MIEQPELLCQYFGGSHSYGLNTPTSDIDYRGIYVHDDAASIINPLSQGTKASNTLVETAEAGYDQQDIVYQEFRHFLHLLKKGNTQSIEMLFNEKWEIIDPFFTKVQSLKTKLLDPEKIRVSVEGYAMSEYQLAIGARTGKLGGKRREAIDKYGFSPKNFVNLFRILYCAETFFTSGLFPVNLAKSYMHPTLMEVKTYPERFTKARLTEMFDERMKCMELAWDTCKPQICDMYHYDNNVATKLILDCYIDKLMRASKVGPLRALRNCF